MGCHISELRTWTVSWPVVVALYHNVYLLGYQPERQMRPSFLGAIKNAKTLTAVIEKSSLVCNLSPLSSPVPVKFCNT